MKEFKAALVSNDDLEIVINGKELSPGNRKIFKNDFLNIYTSKKRSGSSPEKGISVFLRGGGNDFIFNFRRDSRDEDLYWVYYPKSNPMNLLVGYVETDILLQRSMGSDSIDLPKKD
ncbi:MAG: hypothetical protein V3V12_06580 [Gammaproteobacteria bacterium]